jgi:hypothetical protein
VSAGALEINTMNTITGHQSRAMGIPQPRTLWALFTAVALSLAVAGCGGSPEEAREQLAKLNLKFPDDFMRCVKNNDTLAVRLFLEAGINTEARNDVQLTPLMYAADTRNLEMVQLLLDHGADVFAEGRAYSYKGWRASRIASEQGFSEVARVLLEAERKFAASLGTVPGTYFQVEQGSGVVQSITNRWIFSEDGHFQCFGDHQVAIDPDKPTWDGTYRMHEGTVVVDYLHLSSGRWGKMQLAIIANSLTNRDFHLVKFLGTVPGTYLQVFEHFGGSETRTNRWKFTADGRFQCFWDSRAVGAENVAWYSGTYRVDAGSVFLHYRNHAKNSWEDGQLAITANGLEDRYRTRDGHLVKLSENK